MKRYVLQAEKELIEEKFEVSSTSDSMFEANFNVFPGSPMPVIFKDDRKRVIVSGIWGIKNSEVISTFPKTDVEENREEITEMDLKPCIVPASGFYLWKQSVDDNYPFYIRMLTRKVLGLAGLYRETETEEGKTGIEFAVITKKANVLLEPLEPTMPCILDPENFEEWLSGKEKKVLQSQFKDNDLIPDLAVYRVPELVNDLSNNSIELIQAIPKLRNED